MAVSRLEGAAVKARELPFVRFTPREWFNLGLLLIAMFYLLYLVMMLYLAGIFHYVGLDYHGTWCSLRFGHANGFVHTYDLASQAQFHILANADVPAYAACNTPPSPYPAVFLALLQPLVLLPPLPGFIAWTAFNVALFAVYCYRLSKAVGGDCSPGAVVKLLLAYALYENLMAGQFNVIPFVCFCECILAYHRGQQTRSGAWMAGMLFKPQVLLLVLPGLLIGRRPKVLAGFVLASVVLGIISLGLTGFEGMFELLRLLQYYGGGMPPSFPEVGMNWRGLAINLAPVVGEAAAWAVAIPGLVLTVGAGLAVWLAPRRGSDDDQFVVALLGSFAASSAVTWHSHIYSGLPVLAPLIYLRARGRLPEWLFNAWLALPAAAFFIGTYVPQPALGHRSAGVTMLFVNVALVAWATRELWWPGRATTPRDAGPHGAVRDPLPQPSARAS
jgi:hypothetical protein